MHIWVCRVNIAQGGMDFTDNDNELVNPGQSLWKWKTVEEEFRGLGLTSRKNLCLHPSVKREKSGAVVDARCRSLTAGFVKEKKDRGENVDVCVYHDVRLSTPHTSA